MKKAPSLYLLTILLVALLSNHSYGQKVEYVAGTGLFNYQNTSYKYLTEVNLLPSFFEFTATANSEFFIMPDDRRPPHGSFHGYL